MTEQELDRWTTLVVAEARGQSLSPAARAERRQIEREQPELRGEASLWAEFAELDQPRAGERDDAAMIASVLDHATDQARGEAEPEPEQQRAPARRRWAPVLAVLAVAACIALGLALGELRNPGQQAIERQHDSTIGGAAMAVDEQPQLQIATPGEHRLRRDDCRRAGASAKLCTREQAQFRVAETSTEQHVELELEAGQLRIEVPEHTLVEVRTDAGLVRIRGLVELSYDPSTGEFAIEVIAGEAELIGKDATPIRLGVGATLGLLAAADTPAPAIPEPPIEPEPEPSIEPAPTVKPRAPEPAKPTADELLAAAQRALAAGETATAIERYEQLVRTYPQSHAARTASVSLGRLLLRAGRPRDALATFDQYLDSDATELIEEARYGRIRALRELGRDAEVDAAIDEFLAAHPGSIHRERLQAWRTP